MKFGGNPNLRVHYEDQKSDYILSSYVMKHFEKNIAVATMYGSVTTVYSIITGF